MMTANEYTLARNYGELLVVKKTLYQAWRDETDRESPHAEKLENILNEVQEVISSMRKEIDESIER